MKMISNSTLALQEGAALIDKVTYYNIRIVGFKDPDKLIKRDLLHGYFDEYDPEQDHYVYRCESGQVFKRLKISDKVIDQLIASNTNFGESGTLQVSVHDGSGTNVRCWTVSQHMDYLDRIQEHLLEEYGIITDFSGIKLKTIEINRTFTLQDSFEAYHRVFQLIMCKLAWPMKHEMDWKYNGDKIYPGSYISKSTGKPDEQRYIQFKIYDKTRAVQQVISIIDNICRMEITIASPGRIQKELGTNCISNLTDDKVNEFYDAWVNKYILKPLDKWRKERDKRILEIMKYERAADHRKWKVNTLRTITNQEINQKFPLILDVQDIFHVFPKLKVTPNTCKRYRSDFRKQARSHETVLSQRDDLRLQELIDKLTIHHTKEKILSVDDGMSAAS